MDSGAGKRPTRGGTITMAARMAAAAASSSSSIAREGPAAVFPPACPRGLAQRSPQRRLHPGRSLRAGGARGKGPQAARHRALVVEPARAPQAPFAWASVRPRAASPISSPRGEIDEVVLEVFAAHRVILGAVWDAASTGRADRSRVPSCSRPRWSRERTVPTAQPRAEAASS